MKIEIDQITDKHWSAWINGIGELDIFKVGAYRYQVKEYVHARGESVGYWADIVAFGPATAIREWLRLEHNV